MYLDIGPKNRKTEKHNVFSVFQIGCDVAFRREGARNALIYIRSNQGLFSSCQSAIFFMAVCREACTCESLPSADFA